MAGADRWWEEVQVGDLGQVILEEDEIIDEREQKGRDEEKDGVVWGIERGVPRAARSELWL